MIGLVIVILIDLIFFNEIVLVIDAVANILSIAFPPKPQLRRLRGGSLRVWRLRKSNFLKNLPKMEICPKSREFGPFLGLDPLKKIISPPAHVCVQRVCRSDFLLAYNSPVKHRFSSMHGCMPQYLSFDKIKNCNITER